MFDNKKQTLKKYTKIVINRKSRIIRQQTFFFFFVLLSKRTYKNKAEIARPNCTVSTQISAK